MCYTRAYKSSSCVHSRETRRYMYACTHHTHARTHTTLIHAQTFYLFWDSEIYVIATHVFLSINNIVQVQVKEIESSIYKIKHITLRFISILEYVCFSCACVCVLLIFLARFGEKNFKQNSNKLHLR